MKNFLFYLSNWFGWDRATSTRSGQQITVPSTTITEDNVSGGADTALQLSTVYRCVELLSNVISTLPFFAYRNRGSTGLRDLDRTSTIYGLLHESPNRHMTPAEFWQCMVMNLYMRGNSYARLIRNNLGEVVEMYPIAAAQVTPVVLDTGDLVYAYQTDKGQVVLASESVLHIKDLGNGIVGIDRISYMSATLTEAVRAQAQATKTFKNADKMSGLLYIDKVLTKEQREAVRRTFGEISEGSTSRLFVLEANMKFEPTQMTPEQAQLLTSRQFGVEELCRWFGVPPVLVGHSTVTAWGTGIEQIIDGFYKLTVRPEIVKIEQAVRARVLTPQQRSKFVVEYSFDALLRANAPARFELYAKAVQNGLKTRNECRQLENDPPIDGANELTAQSNLVPLAMLGKVKNTGATQNVPEDTVTQ